MERLKRKIGNFYVFDDEYSDFNEKKEKNIHEE